MDIDDKFTFGKYQGLTLRDVYQGNNKLDRNFVEQFLREKLSNDYSVSPASMIGELLSFEVSDTLIRATSIDKEPYRNYQRDIAYLFVYDSNFLRREAGNTFIGDFVGMKKDENGWDRVLICGGKPEYIAWCINTIEWFFVEPSALEELQTMPVFRFKEMEVMFKIEDIYTYRPIFISEPYQFPVSVLHKNSQKYDSLTEESQSYDNDFTSSADSNRDYFNAMTDGQLGDYGDFRGSSDDIDNWSGR
ncbi:hypothetical protein TH61_16245 [Rufibacter sp. DG15C]|uniref:hypothetical protein n=1 Tax=Rufibacter sp. DG15C TaxID=1379909 RepID=UPI00078EC51A|nr:hypothetical protein [Rufibacter sp. DG15C]AMM52427.1 hypothetical protein TH61_16245 [Rufibacter sp. DG15C]